jgi:hypothetical protein
VETTFGVEPNGDYVYVEVTVDGNTVGRYSYPGDLNVVIKARVGGVYSEYSTNSGFLEFTVYNDVGGTVEGSFDVGLDLVPTGGSVIHLGTAHTATGTFRVERIEYPFPE